VHKHVAMYVLTPESLNRVESLPLHKWCPFAVCLCFMAQPFTKYFSIPLGIFSANGKWEMGWKGGRIRSYLDTSPDHRWGFWLWGSFGTFVDCRLPSKSFCNCEIDHFSKWRKGRGNI